MIQPQTQTESYWVSNFTLTEKDIEHIYNFFLEVEKPQTLEEITRAVMTQRVAEERNEVKRLLKGRTVYQPQKSYDVGDALVFPAMQFARGEVAAVRPGSNPQYGAFNVVTIDIDGAKREFAADLDIEHPLNVDDGLLLEPTTDVDLNELYYLYGQSVSAAVVEQLETHAEFVPLANQWFVKGLMVDINIGHKHLSEAILEMSGGGPLKPSEILVHLDMGAGDGAAVEEFSLNYALLNDSRFDEVGPKGEVAWFLKRMEPDDVLVTPERLLYERIPYDRALLNPQLVLLERELDDEWSELDSALVPQPVIVTMTYPHRACGTLPLSSRVRQLFSLGKAPRQRVTFVDEQSGDEMVGWVVRDGRYVTGLGDWYSQNEIPVGGFLSLKEGAKPGVILINFDRRRPQREWVRLATAEDNRIKFDTNRRSIGCGYDDLLIVGTDYVAAMDGLFSRAKERQRNVASILAELFMELSPMTPQNTVHAKTLYSTINILRRMPPGPMFAELVRHPAFQPVGDHYWQFVSNRWQKE